MDDDQLDGLLHGLSFETTPLEVGPEFQDRVWQRIGEMSEARERRRRTLLGLAIVAVGLGTGMGATQRPAYAEDAGYTLTAGADLSPSALLHVTP